MTFSNPQFPRKGSEEDDEMHLRISELMIKRQIVGKNVITTRWQSNDTPFTGVFRGALPEKWV